MKYGVKNMQELSNIEAQTALKSIIRNKDFSFLNYEAIILLENLGCLAPSETLIEKAEMLLKELKDLNKKKSS